MTKAKIIPDYLAINEEEGYIDVTLARAIDIDGAKVKVIRLREPTVGDIEASSLAKGTDSQKEIQTFASLCTISPDQIRSMSIKNFTRLQEAFVNFTE